MNAIEAEHIQKVYIGAGKEPVRAADGISFAVPRGKIYGLLGPNGAGKSTMVKILTTITQPSSGRALVHGFDVARQPLDVRRHIAVVLQQTAVDGMLTVEDNLKTYAYLHGLPKQEAGKRIAAILEEFELGYKTREMAQDLSQGTKRRLQVAKIFLTDAPVVFLDECTTGMDPFMRRRVLERVRREAKNGKTVLLTTQVLSEAEELCDHIMIIHQGKTLASGNLRELRRLSKQTFRVRITFAQADGNLNGLLQNLKPAELNIEGENADLLFKGEEETSLLDHLAAVSRKAPIKNFEVRGASLEDIFVDLVGEQKS
ncbi:MAG: ABC transporter ATP-binding protein [Elusimicrobia bacterium]|nr:ABC transporter ATP-binding protein [Elusimicrobiota bacterium]